MSERERIASRVYLPVSIKASFEADLRRLVPLIDKIIHQLKLVESRLASGKKTEHVEF